MVQTQIFKKDEKDPFTAKSELKHRIRVLENCIKELNDAKNDPDSKKNYTAKHIVPVRTLMNYSKNVGTASFIKDLTLDAISITRNTVVANTEYERLIDKSINETQEALDFLKERLSELEEKEN